MYKLTPHRFIGRTTKIGHEDEVRLQTRKFSLVAKNRKQFHSKFNIGKRGCCLLVSHPFNSFYTPKNYPNMAPKRKLSGKSSVNQSPGSAPSSPPVAASPVDQAASESDATTESFSPSPPPASSLSSSSPPAGPSPPSTPPSINPRVHLYHIDKNVGRPSPRFPPLGDGRGKKSQFEPDLRLAQKQLQEDRASEKRNWSPRFKDLPKKKLPARRKPPSKDSPLTTAKQFRAVSKKVQNTDLDDKKRGPPRKKPATEANFLDDDDGVQSVDEEAESDGVQDDDDGAASDSAHSGDDGAASDSAHSGSTTQTPQTDSPQKSPVKIPATRKTKSTPDLTDDNAGVEEHGVTDAMRAYYHKRKQEEEEVRKAKELEVEKKALLRQQQLLQLGVRPRVKRSKSMDPLSSRSEKRASFDRHFAQTRPATAGSPPSSVSTAPPTQPKIPPSPPPKVKVAVPPPAAPPQLKKPVPPPKPKSKPAQKPAIPSKPEQHPVDVFINTFPAIAARAHFREQLMGWDPKICDMITGIVDEVLIELTEDDRILRMDVSDDLQQFIEEMNSLDDPSHDEQEKMHQCNENTKDMIAGIILCALERMYGNKKFVADFPSALNPPDPEVNDARSPIYVNPNSVLHVLVPVLLRAFAELNGNAPFLKKDWVKSKLGPSETWKGPGKRLTKKFLTTCFAHIQNRENNELWARIGPHLVYVEDGKSLYPRQCATDIAMSALLHLRVMRSRSDPSQNLSLYLSAKDFAILHRARGDPIYEATLQQFIDDIQDISVFDLFFAPLHIAYNAHWMLAVAEMKTRTIELYDAFQNTGMIGCYTNPTKNLRSAPDLGPVVNELTEKLETVKLFLEQLTGQLWCEDQNFLTMLFVQTPMIPRQCDIYSCGPLCQAYAELRMSALEFFQEDNTLDMQNCANGNLNARLFRDIETNGLVDVHAVIPHSSTINPMPLVPPQLFRPRDESKD